MRKLLFLFLLLFATGYAANYIKFIDKITGRFVKEMRKEKGMHPICYGGRMMYDIEQVDLEFTLSQEYSIDEARLLFVEVAERYLSAVNEDTKVRPYLHNVPFTMANFSLGITFENSNKDFVSNGHMAYVYYLPCKEKLIYNCHDLEKDLLYKVHEESYEEAFQIVKEQQQTLTQVEP